MSNQQQPFIQNQVLTQQTIQPSINSQSMRTKKYQCRLGITA